MQVVSTAPGLGPPRQCFQAGRGSQRRLISRKKLQVFSLNHICQHFGPSQGSNHLATHLPGVASPPRRTLLPPSAAGSVASNITSETRTVFRKLRIGEPVFEGLAEILPLPPLVGLALATALEVFLSLALAKVATTALAKAAKAAEQASQERAEIGEKRNIPMVLLEAGLLALKQPAALLLPAIAALHSARLLTCYADNFLSAQNVNNAWRNAVATLIVAFHHLDKLLDDSVYLTVLALGVWLVIAFKDKVVDIVVQAKITSESMDRLLQPLSTLSTWAILVTGVLWALHILGINIQPFLTVGGFSGIVVGFGAQNFVSNALSGINLFISQPFLVGDRVTLMGSGGSAVISGIVERIDPLRTIFRNDSNIPVSIPNKAINDMLVANETQIGRARLPSHLGGEPRKFSTKLSIKYEDIDKIEAIVSDLKAFLKAHPDVNPELPASASLDGFGDSHVNVSVLAHTHRRSNVSDLKNAVLTEIAKVVKKHGATFGAGI